MFKNVYKLLPGHYFIHKDGKTEIHQYYKFNYDHIDENQTIEGDAKKIQGIVIHWLDTKVVTRTKDFLSLAVIDHKSIHPA